MRLLPNGRLRTESTAAASPRSHYWNESEGTLTARFFPEGTATSVVHQEHRLKSRHACVSTDAELRLEARGRNH